MTALPSTDYKITLIDFNGPVLGTQHAGLKTMAISKQIAPCRTFCFLHELEMLLDHNLIKGGDINNAIVVVDKPGTEREMERLARAFGRDKIEVKSEGYLNNLELRFPNEPARHKLLDVIGDLALIDIPSRLISLPIDPDTPAMWSSRGRSSNTSGRTNTSRIFQYTIQTSSLSTIRSRSKRHCRIVIHSC